jgi:hypothetical protein
MTKRLKLSQRFAPGGFLASLLLAFLFLALIEGSLRFALGAPRKASDYKHWQLDFHGPFFKIEGDEYVLDRRYLGTQRFPRIKRSDTRRVFLIGESAAAEFAAERPLPLEEILGKVYPGFRFEFIGLGQPGYDSFRVGFVFREIMRYEPDLIIVMSGNNEYHDAAPPKAVAHVEVYLSHFKLYEMFKEMIPSSLGRRIPYEERMREYRENLARMARQARAAGVPIVFCTLPANLAGYASSDYNNDSWSDAEFLAALRLHEQGRHAEAAAALRASKRMASGSGRAGWVLGRSLLAQGKFDEARAVLINATEYDSSPGVRSPPSRSRLVRETAAKEGAIIADLADFFARRAPRGIVGAETMVNNAHWHRDLNAWAALLIAKAVTRAGVWKADLGPEGDKTWRRLENQARAAEKPFSARAQAFWRQALCAIINERGEAEWLESVLLSLELAARLDPAGMANLKEEYPEKLQMFRCFPGHLTPDRYPALWMKIQAYLGEHARLQGNQKRARTLLETSRDLGLIPRGVARSLAALYSEAGELEAARRSLEALPPAEAAAWGQACGVTPAPSS